MDTKSREEAMERVASIRDRISHNMMDEREAAVLISEIGALLQRIQKENWAPYPWQIPPSAIPTMGTWLMLGGRGTGKTEGGSRYLDAHMQGPPCDDRIKGGHRAAIVAPTLGDAVEACVTGPSGIQTINPQVEMKGGVEGTRLIWPNGSVARLFGVFTRDDVERLRAGGNRCCVWLEEMAAMRFIDEALTHTRLGLRIGHNPHFVASTTPKPLRALKNLINDARTITTAGRTRDAYHLDEAVREVYFQLYEGTRLGRQELDAELLGDIEGALWTQELIENTRVKIAPEMDRIVVGVDPPGGKTECGIVVVGLSGREIYVLADLSDRLSPHDWASAAVRAYHTWQANAIVAEGNYGGDMVENTLASVEGGDSVYIKRVHAKVGKAARAEPVVALFQRGMAHHVGAFGMLETEQTEWVPTSGAESPNRLDAMVWAATDLAVKFGPTLISNPAHARRESSPLLPGSSPGGVVLPFGRRAASG